MKQKPINCSAAFFTQSLIAIKVCIFWRKFMASFAMRSCSSNLGSLCYGFLQRISFSNVCALFFSGSPNTIIRVVSFFIVFPLNRHFERAWPHILNKVFESESTRFHDSPSFAYDNPTPTPIFKIRSFGIFASLNHIGPSPIKGLKCFISHV